MSLNRRTLLSTLVAGCLASGAPDALAQDRKVVQWAGVSLAGDFSQLPRLMPTLYELLTQDAPFLERFRQRVALTVSQSASSIPGLQILVDDQVRQGDDAYALSFVMAGESITAYAIEQTTFVDFVVQALVLVGNVSRDPSRQRIVASYPVQVRYQHAYPDGQQPSAEGRKTIVAAMLMGQAGKADLVAEWHKRLGQLRLSERDVWVAVAPLQILPQARQQGNLSDDFADRVAFRVSSAIEGNISQAADIPIVPSTFDGALTQLTLSFADRSIVAFQKPDPSHVLQVSVYALVTSSAEEAMTREKKFAVAYGGGFLVEYFSVDPDRRRHLELGMRLQKVQSVTYLGTSLNDQRASAADMFSRLIAGFAHEMSNKLIPADALWLENNKAASEPRTATELAQLATAKLPTRRRPD
ncbi:MAG: hypothetical protein QUV35_12965 [Hydrogenophaga sp.]|uniref:hypothetical protein n=1 Tax=Hydrogenophaga sp. TaxID=1904254 RepID=UPI00261EB6ED|nr:hypothetical protein [Hydrogenophaga sp.]MDM7943528.1 hypothetical protein [Hydrogenophaga sp.]